MVHACNSSTCEGGTGRLQVGGQPELHIPGLKKIKKKIPDDLSMNPVAHAHIQLLLDMHLGIDFVDHKLLLY